MAYKPWKFPFIPYPSLFSFLFEIWNVPQGFPCLTWSPMVALFEKVVELLGRRALRKWVTGEQWHFLQKSRPTSHSLSASWAQTRNKPASGSCHHALPSTVSLWDYIQILSPWSCFCQNFFGRWGWGVSVITGSINAEKNTLPIITPGASSQTWKPPFREAGQDISHGNRKRTKAILTNTQCV